MNKVTFFPESHKYVDEAEKERVSVTQILKHFGMCPDFEKWGNETARNFGSVVHRVCELNDKGELDQYDYDRRVDPWLNGYRKFLDAFGPEYPQWLEIETPMISNVWHFAGTPDRVCVFTKNANTIIDIKTGSEDPSHKIQTAGYEVLVDENLKIRIKKRFSLYLMPDDFRLVEHKNKSDRSVFIGLAQAYNWKLNHKLIGGES